MSLMGIGLVLLIGWRRRLSFAEVYGLRRAALNQTLLFTAIYVVWMLATNALVAWRGPWDFTIWRESPLMADILRVLAVGVLGPIAEELIFRGLLQGLLTKTRLGPAISIVLIAAVWAAIHVDYSFTVIAILFVCGLLLGVSRWRTGSLIPAMVMHVIWNLFAVW